MAHPSTLHDIGKVVIGIGGLVVHCGHTGAIVTYALGSCLGVTLWDSVAKVGGMLHAQIPTASFSPERATIELGLSVELGIPALFHAAYALGAVKSRLRITAVGCADSISSAGGMFAIGKSNLIVMRKVFWQNSVLLAGEDVGGAKPRTVTIDFSSGETWVDSAGKKYRI